MVGRDAYLIGSIMGKREPPRNNTVESLTEHGERRPVTVVAGLVLAVRPQDASSIAQAQATAERLDFVLHGRQEILSGRLLDVRCFPPSMKGTPSKQAHRRKLK